VKSRRRALFVSRLHPKKGLDLLLPAWAALGDARKDWELIIAGPDEGGYASVIDRLIQDLDLGASIRRVGKVSQESKVSLLNSADLFVLPSHSEGFPSAILEAMAAAVPVVATRECNFSELFQEQGGWECHADRDSLMRALRQALAASDCERRDRGAASRRLLLRKYTWESVCADLLEACAKYCR